MNRKIKHRYELVTAKLIDYLLVTLPFAICWELYYKNIILNPFQKLENIAFVFFYLLMFMYFCKVYDADQISLHRISEVWYSQILSFLIADGFIYIIICILYRRIVTIIPGLLCILGQILLSLLWSYLVHQWYFKSFPAKKSIVVFDNIEGLENLINEYGLSKKFNVETTMNVGDCINNLSTLDAYETVFLSDIHSHDRNIIMKYCILKDKDMYIIPRLGDIILSGAMNLHMFHLPIFRLRRYNPHLEYLIMKRCFDILVSGIAIVLLSPFMLVTAIAIKAYDGGPALYKQVRLTKDGEKFEILKFRSMRVDAEKYSGAVLSAGDNDPRITPVGRIVRKIRFDELPQLINILNGDMSIVGPRPERPEIAEQYEKVLPEFKLRLQVKAGLTGYAQVYGKYNTTPYNKLQMDLMYIAHPSFIEDMRICMATIKILFLPESTEGVAAGQTTALNYEDVADSTEKDDETEAK